MNNFAVTLVFQISIFEGNHQPQFDQQIRLIEACNEREAIDKATQLGRRIELEQLKDMQWKYIGATEISLIKELKDGASLFSKTEEVDNANDYLMYIKERIKIIKDQASKFSLFHNSLSF